MRGRNATANDAVDRFVFRQDTLSTLQQTSGNDRPLNATVSLHGQKKHCNAQTHIGNREPIM